MRTKKKDWKMVAFSLDKSSLAKLDQMSDYEGISKTDMVDLLINNWSDGINPNERLKSLNSKKIELQAQLKKIDEEITNTISHITVFNDWQKQKQSKKKDAIRILQKSILRNDFEEAERLSKMWQKITGIPAMELIMDARTTVEESGI